MLMCKQVEDFIKNKLSSLLTGFRKSHSTQQCLVNVVEEWKKKLDNDKTTGSIFIDPSKAFDIINRDLLIPKLEGYRLSDMMLMYMRSYLNNRKHRVTFNNTFRSREDVIVGVPSGSILEPLLFNIFLNDLVLFVTNPYLDNYADDNTLFCSGDSISDVNNKRKPDFA